MGTGYRPPSKEPKGRWARHIHAKRREFGWSQTRGFEAVREGMGLSEKSRAAYIAIDMGDRQPTAAEETVLIAVYGIPEEPAQKEAGPALSGEAGYQSVVAAIDRQTAAIVAAIQGRDAVLEGLLSELGRYRESQLQVIRALQEAPRPEPMPADEPVPAPRGGAPTQSERR